MATQLSLYNGALLECGERSLASLTENREPRRLLDAVWNSELIDLCLGKGQFTFATRSTELAPSTSLVSSFGYQLAYEQPSDFIRTVGIYADEYSRVPLLDYVSEARYWFTDIEPIFVSYVSNGPDYGGTVGSWPAEFSRAVEIYLASRIVKKLTQSVDDEVNMLKKADMAFREVKSSDAMESPTRFLPQGSWSRARLGARNRDGGTRRRLT